MKYAPKAQVLAVGWLLLPRKDRNSKEQRSSRGPVQYSGGQWCVGGIHTAHLWVSIWGKTNPSCTNVGGAGMKWRHGDAELNPFWVWTHSLNRSISCLEEEVRRPWALCVWSWKANPGLWNPSSHFFSWFCSKDCKKECRTSHYRVAKVGVLGRSSHTRHPAYHLPGYPGSRTVSLLGIFQAK